MNYKNKNYFKSQKKVILDMKNLLKNINFHSKNIKNSII